MHSDFRKTLWNQACGKSGMVFAYVFSAASLAWMAGARMRYYMHTGHVESAARFLICLQRIDPEREGDGLEKSILRDVGKPV